eukprot:120729-Chlamydomonas_euryale.AAC.1
MQSPPPRSRAHAVSVDCLHTEGVNALAPHLCQHIAHDVAGVSAASSQVPQQPQDLDLQVRVEGEI